MKGFIVIPLEMDNGRVVDTHMRPEAISMFAPTKDGRTLIWFDPLDSSLPIDMPYEDFVYHLQQASYEF